MFLFSQPTGPYTIIIGTPSKIEDVIQYADFTQKVSAVELVDDTTLDEEPNLDDLYGLMDGNIQLNNTDLHVLPAGEFQKYVIQIFFTKFGYVVSFYLYGIYLSDSQWNPVLI